MPAEILNAAALRERYLTEAIQTATPATRLVMVLDKLELDLHRADQAFESGDLKEVNDNLVHAQEILLALRGTMQVDLWEGAPRVVALYDYLHNELLHANIDKDRARAVAATEHITALAGAWRQAAAATSEPLVEVAGGVA